MSSARLDIPRAVCAAIHTRLDGLQIPRRAFISWLDRIEVELAFKPKDILTQGNFARDEKFHEYRVNLEYDGRRFATNWCICWDIADNKFALVDLRIVEHRPDISRDDNS